LQHSGRAPSKPEGTDDTAQKGMLPKPVRYFRRTGWDRRRKGRDCHMHRHVLCYQWTTWAENSRLNDQLRLMIVSIKQFLSVE
jgi:hypothetical protein